VEINHVLNSQSGAQIAKTQTSISHNDQATIPQKPDTKPNFTQPTGYSNGEKSPLSSQFTQSGTTEKHSQILSNQASNSQSDIPQTKSNSRLDTINEDHSNEDIKSSFQFKEAMSQHVKNVVSSQATPVSKKGLNTAKTHQIDFNPKHL
jgi:hypothetical protein